MDVEVTDIRRDKEIVRAYSGDTIMEEGETLIYTVWYKVTINGIELEGQEEFELGLIDLSFDEAEAMILRKLSKEDD